MDLEFRHGYDGPTESIVLVPRGLGDKHVSAEMGLDINPRLASGYSDCYCYTSFLLSPRTLYSDTEVTQR